MTSRQRWQLLSCEMVGFLLVVALIWLNELLDLPNVLFGAAATPVNVAESIIETVVVGLLAALTALTTWLMLRRIGYLEGLVSICCFCKKIRLGDEWIPLEQYVEHHSDAAFSHGCCPACFEKHYPEYM